MRVSKRFFGTFSCLLFLLSYGWGVCTLSQNTCRGNITASDSGACSTAGACITFPLNTASNGAVGLSVSGSFSATNQFEVSADGGATWVSAQGTTPSGGTATSATAAGTWRFATSGLTNFRVRASVFSSGPVVVSIQQSPVAAGLNGGGTGGSSAFAALTSGTNTAAAMVVGSGASLAASGTGTIVATSAPIKVDGVVVNNPNLSSTAPSAALNAVLMSISVSGSNISYSGPCSAAGMFVVRCYNASDGSDKIPGSTIAVSLGNNQITMPAGDPATASYAVGQGIFLGFLGTNSLPFCSVITAISGAQNNVFTMRDTPSFSNATATPYHDDGEAMQAAITAGNNSPKGGAVVFSPGTFNHFCKPLYAYSAGASLIKLWGAGKSITIIESSASGQIGHLGPGFFATGTDTNGILGAPGATFTSIFSNPALLGGGSGSFTASTSGSNGYYFDAKQSQLTAAQTSTNQYSAFTFEDTYSPTANPCAQNTAIINSSGKRDSQNNDASVTDDNSTNRAYLFGVDTSCHPVVELKTSTTGRVRITGGVLTWSTTTTTGTVSLGTPTTVTAASGTSFANNDYISIPGCGPSGNSLATKITAGGGTTTWTISTACSTAVNGAVIRHIYHVTGSYGSGNLHAYVNGVEITNSPTAMAGTVVQSPYEEEFIGHGTSQQFPSGSGTWATAQGIHDGFRLSNACRYCSGNFTPPATKFTTANIDNTTLIQYDFGTFYNRILVGYTWNTFFVGTPDTVYTPVIDSSSWGGIDNFAMEGIKFIQEDGIFLDSGPGLALNHIGLGPSYQGFQQGYCCTYNVRADDISVDNGTVNSKYGFLFPVGDSNFANIQIGAGFGTGAIFAGNIHLNTCFYQNGSQANEDIGILFRNAGSLSAGGQQATAVVNWCTADSESVNANVTAVVVSDQMESLTLNNNNLECAVAGPNCYALRVQGGNSGPPTALIMNGGGITGGSSTTAAVQCLSCTAGTDYLEFHGVNNVNKLPWSTVPGTYRADGMNARADRSIVASNLSTLPLLEEFTNDTSTGTATLGVVKLNGTSKQVVIASSTDTHGGLGIAQVGAGKTGVVAIAMFGMGGQAVCSFDGATTANHYVQMSALVGGKCHDTGSTMEASSGQILGHAVDTASAVAAPGTPRSFAFSSSTLAAGTYKCEIVWVDPLGGRTTISPEVTTTITINQGLICDAAILTPPPGITAFQPFVTNAGSGTETLQGIDSECVGGAVTLNGVQACSTSGGYVLNTLLSGAAPPGVNTAGPGATVSLNSEDGTPPNVQAIKFLTDTNCSSSASPAVCSSASAGSVAVPTGTNPTLTVNTTAVTANSQIMVQQDESLGTKLSVTCNSSLGIASTEPVVTARTAGASFQITISGVVASNPVCLSYVIIN